MIGTTADDDEIEKWAGLIYIDFFRIDIAYYLTGVFQNDNVIVFYHMFHKDRSARRFHCRIVIFHMDTFQIDITYVLMMMPRHCINV